MDNPDDYICSEEWADTDTKDDPNYTPEVSESSEPSEAGSEWSYKQPSVS